MADRLALIADRAEPDELPFLSGQRADRLRQRLQSETNPDLILQLLPDYAKELVNAGRSEEAIKQLDRLDALLRSRDPDNWRATIRSNRLMEAVAYLRLGEQENCLLRHTSDSCLLPIQGGGVHTLQRGSRGAVRVLTEMLRYEPNDMSVRWLLNLAYMTLGEYPAHVPKPWLIPPQVFRSDFDTGRFRDVASGLGLDVNGLSGGVIIEDFDGDGYLDIMTSALGLRDRMHYFHNNADGTFTDWTDRAGLTGELGGLNMIQTDYNNDGFPDVLVLRGAWFGTQGHHPLSLLRNNGNGTFTNVTEQAGLLRFRPTQTAVWLDYNGDGWLDLFVGNESRPSDTNPCELFRNNGDGTFTECAAEAGVAAVGLVKGVVSADYDRDGRPDLYVSVQGGENHLFHNDGPASPNGGPRSPWHFTDVARQAGVTEPVNSFSCLFFDYDNDGWPDLFVSGYPFDFVDVGSAARDYLGQPNRGPKPRLYHNERNGHFRDVTSAKRLSRYMPGMGINFGDLDGDGWLDFYIGTGTPDLSYLVPNRMFRNTGGALFQDVTTSGGFGHLQKGHAVAFADIRNCGDQDVYEVMGGALSGDTAFSVLYENPGHPHEWISLKLEGTRSNRAAVGATVEAVAVTPRGKRSIWRTVGSGGSFGANPFRLEIGLGDATAVDHVDVHWPSGGPPQTLRGLRMNAIYRVREGAAAADPIPLKRLTYSKTEPPMHHHHGGAEMGESAPTTRVLGR